MTLHRENNYKELLKLGLPVLLSQLGNVVVGQADTMMVGAYGTNELAAAAFVNNLMIVPMVMQMGFAAGVTPLIGELYGSGKLSDAGSMLRVGLRLNLLAGLALCSIMGVIYFFLPAMGQDPVLMPLIRSYYLIMLCSLIAGSIFFPTMQFCNGITDTTTPMWIIIGTNVLNIGGNYLLIFGKMGMPELGLTGAGISTIGARMLSAVVFLAIVIYLKRYASYRDGLRRHMRRTGAYRRLFATSWPVMVQSGIETLLWALGAVVCGWYSKHQLAGFQVVLSISQLGFLTYMSFATAVAIRVANFKGAGEKRGMYRTAVAGLHLNLILGTLACAIFLIFGRQLIHLFTDDISVISAGMTLMLPMIIYQYGDAIQMLYGNALRGTGHVLPMVWISIVSYAILGIGSMALLAGPCGLESRGVYYSFSVALFAAAFLYRRSFIKAIA